MARLGLQARLYRKVGTSWNEVAYVKDTLTLTGTRGEVDVSTRASPAKQFTGDLLEWGLEFTLIPYGDSTDFVAFRDAFLNKTPIDIRCLDGDVTVSGSQGLECAMEVMNMERAEPLNDAITYQFSLKPAFGSNPQWVVIA